MINGITWPETNVIERLIKNPQERESLNYTEPSSQETKIGVTQFHYNPEPQCIAIL